MILRELHRENLRNRVIVARDGEEALDILFCRGAFAHRWPEMPPKLILLDRKLPKVGGLEVLREIKSSVATRASPVVMRNANPLLELKHYNLGIRTQPQRRSPGSCSARSENLHLADPA